MISIMPKMPCAEVLMFSTICCGKVKLYEWLWAVP